jgi:hypothetical protein
MKSNKDMEASNTLGEETNEEAEATGKTAKRRARIVSWKYQILLTSRLEDRMKVPQVIWAQKTL